MKLKCNCTKIASEVERSVFRLEPREPWLVYRWGTMSDWLGGGLMHNSYTQCARSQARSDTLLVADITASTSSCPDGIFYRGVFVELLS